MNLTPTEQAIVCALQAKSGHYVRTAKLEALVSSIGALRVYIHRLRKKGCVIDNSYVLGYRLVEEGKAVE